jgi:hypothetical protein
VRDDTGFILFSSLRSAVLSFPRNYRFSRKPARVTLAVAGVASALLAIAVVALGLSLGSAPAARPAGQSRTALAANSGATSGAASGAVASRAADRATAAGSGTRPSAPAAQHSPAAKAAPAASAAPVQATAHHRRQHHAAAQAQVTAAQAQPQPYLIYDSVDPQAIPGNPVVATYADGPNPDPPSSVANFTHVLWVDIDASDPQAHALDIEPGCATPSEAAGWVSARLNADPHGVAILYTMISEWSQVQADVSSLPSWMQSRIRWWIADPTGSPHIVPGSQATQWYWGQNYDISTALPGF